MIISAYQPYFAPFSGFFAKALRSDLLVLMDRVQFPRGTTWLTRNCFKNDQGDLWMTIPVWKKGLGLQKIIPNLSAFDLLFNCGPKGHDILSGKKVSS